MGRKASPWKYFWQRIMDRTDTVGVHGVDAAYLQQLWESQDGKCAYSGLPMLLPDIPEDSCRTVKFGEGCNPILCGSVDRIDSALPYQPGNLQFVCRGINHLKSDAHGHQVMAFLDLYKQKLLTEATLIGT